MLCLLRPLLWLKCCSECFHQTLKTGNRIPTQTGCPCDLFSCQLPYLGFILRRQQRNIHVAISVTLLENVGFTVKIKVKSAYEPKWPIRPELIPVSVALSD